ncbi:N-acetylmuramoyl-L-alanine amidase [Candidatus Peregrinibacteria bacterium]|nr:N-acetylmuramoyl-L-alanine amidase [Candidatus Peregrinibacteria bacterium]
MRRWLLFGAPIILGIVTAVATAVTSPHHEIKIFADPIDALSVGFSNDAGELEVSARIAGQWTDWETLETQDEPDPLLRESNLVIFPGATSTVRFRGTRDFNVHPIRISHEPISYELASHDAFPRPRVLKRADWGADESLLVDSGGEEHADEPQASVGDNGNGNGTPSNRVRDCEDLHANYPDEFTVERTVMENENGELLRWPQQYSPQVRVLVVHHTALKVNGDDRHPVERVRALYQYHTLNRGWGDIGYHYIVDEKGQIYEGRAGGRNVIGGHVYCNNVGTVGIALLGNFDLEQPTQAQMRSLQWLLADLAEEYDINLSRNVTFRGKSLPPIVGHRQLVSTECPGYYVWETLDQVRRNTSSGNLGAGIVFPNLKKKYEDRTETRKAKRAIAAPRPVRTTGLFAAGSENILGRPGEEILFTMKYVAGTKSVKRREDIGKIAKSRPDLGLWQEINGRFLRMTKNVDAPETVKAGEEVLIRIRAKLPNDPGTTTLMLGDVSYVFKTEGRRSRSAIGESSRQSPLQFPSSRNAPSPSVGGGVARRAGERGGTGKENENKTTEKTDQNDRESQPSNISLIRIRLGYEGADARIEGSNTLLNGASVTGPVLLSVDGSNCRARESNTSGVLRLESVSPLKIASWNRPANRFRGALECRVIEGKLVLINELSLEDYLAGLAEEPDSEPWQKQRAFAIAARTYAAYYIDASNPRKFPGMPYDGSDSPATFQAYGGVLFEEQNSRWTASVKDTAHQVLQKNGKTIKAPYFSSDAGRTRSLEEAGWKDFPFPEIFSSKEDPWCSGMQLWGHGVGMSGCGAEGQANEGKTAEEILRYYYPGTIIENLP